MPVALNSKAMQPEIGYVTEGFGRRILSNGSSVTSLPVLVRGTLAALLCAAPAFFALKLATNWGTPAAMVSVVGLVLSAGPCAVLLPALKATSEVATRADMDGRRLERQLRAQFAMETADDGTRSTTGPGQSSDGRQSRLGRELTLPIQGQQVGDSAPPQ
jgi:hypothetical protein